MQLTLNANIYLHVIIAYPFCIYTLQFELEPWFKKQWGEDGK